MWTRTRTIFTYLACLGLLASTGACEDGATTPPEEEVDRLTYWEQRASEVAIQTGAFELGCPQVTPQTLGRNDAVMVKWYSIGVTGCGKRVLYQVTCAHQQCNAERKSEITDLSTGAAMPAASSEPPPATEPVPVPSPEPNEEPTPPAPG